MEGLQRLLKDRITVPLGGTTRRYDSQLPPSLSTSLAELGTFFLYLTVLQEGEDIIYLPAHRDSTFWFLLCHMGALVDYQRQGEESIQGAPGLHSLEIQCESLRAQLLGQRVCVLQGKGPLTSRHVPTAAQRGYEPGPTQNR